MPYFLCRIATEDGHTFSQSFLAPSVEDCRKHFEEEGLCVLSVKRDWKKIQISATPFEKRIKDKDFILFNQELVALIKAGYPILRSIEVIVRRVKDIHLKELLMNVENDVRGGKSLSEAFAPYERAFSRVYIASLMAGEKSGNLAGSISRYINYAKAISLTKTRIRTALTYPTLLLIFSFFLLSILLIFVLPRFASFYADFEAQLPAITRVLMSVSQAVKTYFLFIIAFLFVLFLVYLQLKRREKVLILRDKLKLKIPYGGPIWLESGIALFSRTLSLLLEAGISLLSAVGITRQAVPNRYLIQKMRNLPNQIKNGESLSESLSNADFFPPMSLDMIRIGETSANLEGMLRDVADFYDERIQTKIDTFISLIEPIIIILMGLLVAGMLLSVYLPIFNIIRVAR
ncbi:MAG: type II secretion system F family protein [Candidatus Aminicenantes bacterium]|nr:MAG: type II secretion system F family protein [Candidatus Aminicenantes bacterium]